MKANVLRFLFVAILLTSGSLLCPHAEAEGLFGLRRSGQTRGNFTSSRNVRNQPTYQRRTSYPTRNLNQGRSRLPSGRTYYQGRYYGNLNNRFYGPQYGYF